MSTLKADAFQDTSGKGFYPARAWINFQGTGTITIRDDGNFSSLTDHTTGDYTATYTNSFPNTNYAPVVMCKEHDSTGNTTVVTYLGPCLLYTSPSPRDGLLSRMPSSA